MLLNEEEKKGFEPEQIQVIEDAYKVKETELTGLANKNADGILNGFADTLTAITGLQRNGNEEKVSSFFDRTVNDWLPSDAKTKVEKAEKSVLDIGIERDEWKVKFENHKGDETLKTELQSAQEKIAEFPNLLQAKETEWSTKYSDLETTHNTSKLNRSIVESMPKFDDNVNKFELEAKKKSAIERIKQTYELSYDDNGNLIGTKEYDKTLVSELLKTDEELKDLILIEQNSGGGGEGGSGKAKTLNLPEAIGKGASQEIIKLHIINNENIDFLDDKFHVRFKELCKENKVL